MSRHNGSVKVFIIFGVVLVAVTLGVLYGAGQFGKSDQVPPLTAPSDSQSTGDEAGTKDSDKDSDDTIKNQPSDDGAMATDTSQDHPSTRGGQSGQGSHTEGLPATGPAEDLATGLALALLAASSVAYIRSRQYNF